MRKKLGLLILIGLVVLTAGCDKKDNPDKEDPKEVVLAGTYNCVYSEAGLQYSMDYEFLDTGKANITIGNSASTVALYQRDENIVVTLNGMNNKEMTGTLSEKGIVFMENGSQITCTKR